MDVIARRRDVKHFRRCMTLVRFEQKDCEYKFKNAQTLLMPTRRVRDLSATIAQAGQSCHSSEPAIDVTASFRS